MTSSFRYLLGFIALAQTVVSSTISKPAPVSQGKNGAVVGEMAECTAVGASIMEEQKGNAADAMIATALCTGVLAAYHSGIGGGGFMIVRFPRGKNHEYEMIDFRETMPDAGNKTMYVDNPDPKASTIGGLAVGVPGEMRGWEMLHRRHGKLPWKRLFEPAIKLARYGFIVNKSLESELNAQVSPFLLSDPIWAEVYAPHGTVLKEGDRCFRRRYANTLEKIANGGAHVFYEGEIAENTVKAIQQRNGIMTTHDLANYTALLRTPANITYHNHRIFSTVAPSSGMVVLMALKIFEGFPGNASDDDPAINVTTHQLIQSVKFGYGARANLGDPAFTANVSTLEAEFISEQVTAELRAKINDTHNFEPQFYDPDLLLPVIDHGTSHMAAVDKEGMAISLTTTVNLIWGSQIMTEDGIILNDEMDDFSSPGQVNSFGFAASPANFIQGTKRPLSSISSSIVEDRNTGAFMMATGSAGGSRIITATLQNIHYVVDQGLSPQKALHHGRWHDQLSISTSFETPEPELSLPGFSNETVSFLASINYNVTFVPSLALAEGHIITQALNGVFTAVSDPRSLNGGASAS